MSQFFALTEDGEKVMYGLDHALGWFIDYYVDEDAEEPYQEESTLFTGISEADMVRLLEDTNCPRDHIKWIAMDIDPAVKHYGAK